MISDRVSFIISALLFRLSLDVIYVLYMMPEFGTHFLTPMPYNFDAVQYTLSLIFAVIPLFVVPFDKRTLNGLFFLAALMLTYLPLTTMYGFDSQRSSSAIIGGLLAILVCVLLARVRFARLRFPVVRNGESILLILCIAGDAFFFLTVFSTGAIANLNFDITRIYEFRADTSAVLNVGALAYSNIWTTKILNPLLLCIGLNRRSATIILFAFAMQIMFFGITQHRSHLFTPILVCLIFLLYNSRFSFAGFYKFASAGLLATLGAYLFLDVYQLDIANSLVVRRTFFVPASVTLDWVEFFGSRPSVLWADRFPWLAGPSIYSGESLPKFTGFYFSSSIDLAFNTGLIGAGYAEAGYTGILLYAVLLALSLIVANTLIDNGVPVQICAAILIMPYAAAWQSSDVLTAFSSHGIAVGIAALWLYGARRPSEGKVAGTALPH